MKHLFIVNPTAGGSDKTAIVTERVNAAFSHFETSGDTYEIYVTKAPMDAPGKIKAEAAENERLYFCLAVDVQESNSFWSMDLM